MGIGAKRRIRGRDQGATKAEKPRTPLRDGGTRLAWLVMVSAGLHVVALMAVVYLPGLLPRSEKPVKLFSVTVVNLPKGPAGGGGREPEPVKPPPKPVKEPEIKKPEEKPVKIAAKKPDKKPEPVKEPQKEPEPVKPAAPVGPGQGPIGGGKEDVKADGPVVLEGGEGFDLGPYRAIIERQVGGNWRPPNIASRKKPKVTVSFRIERSGWIKDIRIEEPSGVAMVDRQAQSAVVSAKRLPPFPAGLDVDSLVVHYTFEVTD